MMEYEELLRARAYVEALAEERDPESGETLSLADARCAECLSFVSDVLSHAAARIAPPKPEHDRSARSRSRSRRSNVRHFLFPISLSAEQSLSSASTH